MSDKFFKLKSKNRKNTKGFTLIELLVVVAIIGILSSVVLASLNSAREKSNVALIKSTLKQLYSQAQINFTENGSFVNSNTSYYNLTCTGPGNNLGKIAQPLIDKGIIVKCFSGYGTGYATSPDFYDGDDYLRFGATALIYDTNELKAWSVDENGVVKWDTQGVNASGSFVSPDVTIKWKDSTTGAFVAMDACAKSGGRLPSIEQLRTLYWAYYQGAGATTTPFTPSGFIASGYWSSTPVPSSPAVYSYHHYMINGVLYGDSQTNGYYVRCVR